MSTASHLALSPEIRQLRSRFEEISAESDTLTGPLTSDQFEWKPEAGAWSVGQCLEHLNAVARFYLPRLDEGISEAIRRGLYGEGPFKYSWLGRWSVRFTEPPPRLRLRARKTFEPTPRSKQEITSAFRAYQVQYVDRLHQANGLDLARARVRPPFSAWLRIPLGSGFEIMVAHERRHLWQVRRLIEMEGFPK
jgi:hypothetical protein